MYNKGKIAKSWLEFFVKLFWRNYIWVVERYFMGMGMVWKMLLLPPCSSKVSMFSTTLKTEDVTVLQGTLIYMGSYRQLICEWVKVKKLCSSVAWKLRDSKKSEKCIMSDHSMTPWLTPERCLPDWCSQGFIMPSCPMNVCWNERLTQLTLVSADVLGGGTHNKSPLNVSLGG